jgi:hypothetical protein
MRIATRLLADGGVDCQLAVLNGGFVAALEGAHLAAVLCASGRDQRGNRGAGSQHPCSV